MILKSLKSFRYAFNGIALVFRSENNARIHLLATVFVIALSLYYKISSVQWLWILLSISLVWIMESLNTAVEKLVDLVSPEYNVKAGQIKDISAGAVLIACIFALATGILVFTEVILRIPGK